MATYDKDTLGNRMKTAEQVFSATLPKQLPIIIRVDGKAFHTYTRGMEKPFDGRMTTLMANTAQHLCKEISGARMAYTQSDEISILVYPWLQDNSQPWFDGKVNKIVSSSAAIASVYFTLNSGIVTDGVILKPGLFDSRCFVLPTREEVVNYFIWRQSDCKRNAIQGFARSVFGQKKIHGLPNKTLLAKLMSEKNIDFEKAVSVQHRLGTCVSGDVIDTSMPEFMKDREYIWREYVEPAIVLAAQKRESNLQERDDDKHGDI